MENKKKSSIVLKIIFIGDPAVGKSSLLERISENEFKENIPTTLGVDFIFKNVITNEVDIKIQIFDTAGQERFRSLINSYYKLSDGIIMVFDITDKSSMINLVENWTKTLMLNLSEKTPKILLLGNKSDLRHDSSFAFEPEEVKVQIEKSEFAKFRDLDKNPLLNYKDKIKEDEWVISGGIYIYYIYIQIFYNLK